MNDDTQKLSENLEDYLEIISALSEKTGSARTTDIAAAMNVKKPSVTSALGVLAQRGLVVYQPYKPVVLTPEGRSLANKVTRKHRLLSNFFTEILGIAPTEADEAACKMEHAIDDSMMKKLVTFLKGMSVAMCSECVQSGAECTSTCPHALTLDKLEKGNKAIILTVKKNAEDLEKCGILPSASVKIIEKNATTMKLKTIYGEHSVPLSLLNGANVKLI